MRFGINTFIWTGEFGLDHVDKLEVARQMGFDGVEIPLFSPDTFPAAALHQQLDQHKLSCTVCSVLLPGYSLISPDDAVRSKTVVHLSACIRKTAEVGAQILAGPLYHPVGSFSGVRRTETEWNNAVAAYRELGPVLDETGVQLCIEPLNRFETYFLNTTEDAVRLCDEVGHSHVGILWDTFHANVEEKHLAPALLQCGRHLKHVHTCENDRGTPGTGHVDWPGVFGALKDLRYDGWLTIESFGFSIGQISAAASIWRDLASTPDTIASDGVRFLRKQFDTQR